jgi:hypothetical protein
MSVITYVLVLYIGWGRAGGPTPIAKFDNIIQCESSGRAAIAEVEKRHGSMDKSYFCVPVTGAKP